MKRFKKIASILLAVVMVLAMAVPAMADKITITSDKSGHVYNAYQIFTGDLSGSNTKEDPYVLSNIKWATGVDSDAILKALKELGIELSEDPVPTAKDIAKKLQDNEIKPEVFAKAAAKGIASVTPKASTEIKLEEKTTGYEIKVDSPGYYLVVDTEGADQLVDDAYSSFIMEVIGTATATPKMDYPSVDKQVEDNEDNLQDGQESDKSGYRETADHEIGETFNFKLIARIPENADLKDYKTYKLIFHDTMSKGLTFGEISSLTINGQIVDKGKGESSAITSNEDGTQSWTYTIEDLLTILPDGVKWGEGEITVEVVYTAKLNENAVLGNVDDNKNTVYLEYSNNPNFEGTGKTQEDTVYVFTYKLPGKKVVGGETDKVLENAGFKLYKKDAEGNEWYATVENGKITGWVKDINSATEVKSDNKGEFSFGGLDAGTYYLKESTTPPGYNTMEDMMLELKASHLEGTNYIPAGSGNLAGTDYSNEEAEIIVENFHGSTLPGTGGMGTTLFYIIGGVLVVGAVIVLVSKKRAAK